MYADRIVVHYNCLLHVPIELVFFFIKQAHTQPNNMRSKSANNYFSFSVFITNIFEEGESTTFETQITILHRHTNLFKSPCLLLQTLLFHTITSFVDLPIADEDEGELDYDDNGPSASSSSQHTLRPPGKDEIKDGQWLGVNVRSQGPGGMVMVCAHRYYVLCHHPQNTPHTPHDFP